MAWFFSDSLGDYSAAVHSFLGARPAHNTILLGASETLRARGNAAFGATAPLFGWWQPPAGPVTAAFLHTPPYPVALTSMAPGTAVALAHALAARPRPLGGVNGDAPAAGAFARAWHQVTGDAITVHMQSRLYELGRLQRPDPEPPGQARRANPADRSLLVAWSDAFHREAHGDGPADPSLMVDDRLSYGGFTLWEAGRQPVSMAGLTRPVAGQVRVGPVYTPPEHRGHGYGAAVTCAVSQAALDAGMTDVLLFTDLANPTSNALYQRLGYHPLGDRTVWAFSRAAS